MPDPVIMPIDNLATGSGFTATVEIGPGQAPLKMLLDTGSSTFAVSRKAYDPGTNPPGTTNLLQTAQYPSGSLLGAVIRTGIVMTGTDPAAAITLADCYLAVTYDVRPDNFGGADGIIGLAFAPLQNAFAMKLDTWNNRYDSTQTGLGTKAMVPTLFDQLAAEGLASNKFAFSIQRSLRTLAQPDPSTDPFNSGIFIAGGGAERTDLFSGEISSIAIVSDKYYNTNLLSVQVGNKDIIPVPSQSGTVASNSMVDSGVSAILLDQTIFDKVRTSFAQFDPTFDAILVNNAWNGSNSNGVDQTTIDLKAWPTVTLTMQGTNGAAVQLEIAPEDYWQFDAYTKGQAVAVLCGDHGSLTGQSQLGLPLFCGRYFVFDRTAGPGKGVIQFAPRASAMV
jgi:hypothetical protein